MDLNPAVSVRLLLTFLCLWSKPSLLLSSDSAVNTCTFKSKHNVILQKTSFATCEKLPGRPFASWRFSRAALLEKFPIDKERRNFVREVRKALFSLVAPTPLQLPPELVAVSSGALELLDLNVKSVISDKVFLNVASGNQLVSGSQPSAHRYGGHQFGSWSSQLGDGRAHLLGEYINRRGERWEVQLKGSGKTPYSRRGDGRAVLRSSVREFLASEAMFHLGVPTSRAVSLVVSDDRIMRDQFYDGHPQAERAGVVMRLASSWFRFGSIEVLHENREYDLLRSLVEFVIDQHFTSLTRSSDKFLEFFSAVVHSTADMIARWQAIGFAHGVCNTDNFSLLSLTIDYGPFGFLDKYEPSFVPNTSDDEGLYQFWRQPEAGKFNLHMLWTAMGTLFNDSRSSFKVLGEFDQIYHDLYTEALRRKLGFLGHEAADRHIANNFLQMMQTMFTDYTMSWRELSEVTITDLAASNFSVDMWSLPKLAEHDDWESWLASYTERIQRQAESHGDTDESRMSRMQGVNPRYILRNYMAENAIKQANLGDHSEVRRVHRVLQDPFHKQVEAEEAGYALPPPSWSRQLRVSCSS